jgi:hypothetical protein
MPNVVPLVRQAESDAGAPHGRLGPDEGLGQASVIYIWGFCPWSEELSDYDRSLRQSRAGAADRALASAPRAPDRGHAVSVPGLVTARPQRGA